MFKLISHFRLHGMHEVHTIVIDNHGVCPSVCLSHSSTRLHCAKTAEEIKVLFRVTLLGLVEHCVRRGS